MRGNQIVELNLLESNLATALEIHREMDKCWGVLDYLPTGLTSPIIVFHCKKCNKKVIISHEKTNS